MNNLGLLRSIKFDKTLRYSGKVTRIIGLTVEADGPLLGIGCRCVIKTANKEILSEIAGFKENRIYLMPFGDIEGIAPGSSVIFANSNSDIKVSEAMLGRILNGLGEPIDGGRDIFSGSSMSLNANPPDPMLRKTISEVLTTGIKGIDGLITIGKGQRVGIFAGSGVGKSVLLGMIAKNTNADVNVIALIGERGREVKEFIERDLGEEGLKKSVLVVATSDQAPFVRRMGAFVATAIAEFFRDQGKQVMFMMDSVTRFAMAQREIGLAVGEPPASKGYTPSVFSLLPKLLERAGTSSGEGSITGLYTVLVEGDDLNDPIADSVRSIIDGHIVLDRLIASKNMFPAIAVLKSSSRLMKEIVTEEMQETAGTFRDLLATYNEAEDLINIGAYVKGSNPKIDEAIIKYSQIIDFLKQGMNESYSYSETVNILKNIIQKDKAK